MNQSNNSKKTETPPLSLYSKISTFCICFFPLIHMESSTKTWAKTSRKKEEKPCLEAALGAVRLPNTMKWGSMNA